MDHCSQLETEVPVSPVTLTADHRENVTHLNCYTFELFQMKAFANNIGLYSQSFDLLQIQQYSTKTKTELGKSKQLKHLQ